MSTTTATGQALAQQRFAGPEGGGDRVFWYPLDFGFAVRAYLRLLRPRLLVLMESELWPRMLVECGRAGVPVAVVNARVSDRSFARGSRVRGLWARMLRRVTLFLAQSEEDARRLIAMGAPEERVRVAGNLKYDVQSAGESRMAARIGQCAAERPVVIAGSTLEGEEEMLLDAWPAVQRAAPGAVLVIAPRHPQRFEAVAGLVAARGYAVVRGSRLESVAGAFAEGTVLLLDTIGDLAAVYGVGQAAFVGGSLVAKGGHNPLEAAQFGVPVVMGGSYENFRAMVDGMRAVRAIRIATPQTLAAELVAALADEQGMGERGRAFFRSQAGATGRVVAALLGLVAR